jgi:4a-hydroxytetrahydrobiopterin dehydratase
MSLLTPEQLQQHLQSLPGWAVQNGQLTKTFKVTTFAHAVLFIGAIGQYAEALNHHPDLSLKGYNKVTVELSSHDAGGLTEKDVTLAAQIEGLPHKQPKP